MSSSIYNLCLPFLTLLAMRVSSVYSPLCHLQYIIYVCNFELHFQYIVYVCNFELYQPWGLAHSVGASATVTRALLVIQHIVQVPGLIHQGLGTLSPHCPHYTGYHPRKGETSKDFLGEYIQGKKRNPIFITNIYK